MAVECKNHTLPSFFFFFFIAVSKIMCKFTPKNQNLLISN